MNMTGHSVTIELDEFGWHGLREEAERQGVSIEALVEHAAMYYLADLHSGRAAVKIFRRTVVDRTRPQRTGKYREPGDGPPGA
jgi:hypothetical protein